MELAVATEVWGLSVVIESGDYGTILGQDGLVPGF